MLKHRPAAARGHANFGWLDSRHSFSFGQYFDPDHMGFSDLRVINQDVVQPGQGFGRHSHRDMEILSYVLFGELGHRDSLGNASVIRPGEIQRMTAGTGVEHSEMNPSATDPVSFLQIWVLPERAGLTPGYEQVALGEPPLNGFQAIASQAGGEGQVQVHQDMTLYRGQFEAGGFGRLALAPNRAAWVQLISGSAHVNGLALQGGDGLAIQGLDQVDVHATTASDLLLFDLRA